MNKKPFITLLGAGRWGTAVASLLADNGHNVLLWSIEEEVALDINRNHRNHMYCPDVNLSHNITATTDLQAAITHADWIFEAVPVKYLRSIVEQCKHYLTKTPTWVVLSKGLESKSLMLPTQIITDVLGPSAKTSVLSGPTFSKELIQKQFSAGDVAGSDKKITDSLSELLTQNYFKCSLSNDLIGIQVGGAIKNIFALMIGLASGSGYKDNTSAYLITKGLDEMATLVTTLGGKQETIYGLAGLGDIILSCTGSLSKNLKAGHLIAQGKTIEELKVYFGTLPEGFNTVQSVYELIEQYQLNLPLCTTTYKIIFKKAPVQKLLVD